MFTRNAVGAAVAALTLALCPAPARAFCGFYVSGAGAKLFNNATQVALLRDGTLTVLSMQNNYQGPPSDFAMVVPVPTVLKKEHVKVLPKAIFDRLDQLAAPRLVEYWEQDPCRPPMPRPSMAPRSGRRYKSVKKDGGERDLGVKIEAQFDVGEYQVVVLSARDSSGLETWLRINKYKIPAGAEPYLRPYVQQGMKFFVARVDAKKVHFENGMADLSPLRFHYDSESFALPVRLGLINSNGKQDLIVHILARGQRYEVANYKNVTIPTNLDVVDAIRHKFGQFYATLFDATMEAHPKAVVTEYAWGANSCDPCPTPALSGVELATLGADIVWKKQSPDRPMRRGRRWMPSGWVLTRLHARYDRRALGEDLVFRAAAPIVGGREIHYNGRLETGSRPATYNNFQARYAIRHPWKGPVACQHPRWGIWGGPPGRGGPKPMAARKLAFAKRGVTLRAVLRDDVPELGIKARHRSYRKRR